MKKPRSAGTLQPGTQLTNAHTHICLSPADCWLEYYRNAGNNLFWYGVISGLIPFGILLAINLFL